MIFHNIWMGEILFSFYATKQKIPTYDFLSIINILKTSIKMRLFFTRERIDMTERWMIRSWDFVSTQTSSYFMFYHMASFTNGEFVSVGFFLICFLFLRFFFCFSLNSQKRSHSSMCVFSNSYLIASKFFHLFEVTWSRICFSSLSSSEKFCYKPWNVICFLQNAIYVSILWNVFSLTTETVNLLSSSLQTFLLRTTEERSVEVLN